MLGNLDKAGDAPLFNYTIASADLRYIEIGERAIYLRADPERGLVVRGEIPGCGPGCYVDLSQIFLEFPMSCEGCRERDVVVEAVTYFGERLGKILAARLLPTGSLEADDEQLDEIFNCVLVSLGTPFLVEKSPERMYFVLRSCPFYDREAYAGFTRTVEMARLGFIALCESILQSTARDWMLARPGRDQISELLLEVVLSRK